MIFENDKQYSADTLSGRTRSVLTPYTGLGKLPPQATDLEEAVLGGILIDKNAFMTVIEVLKVECFYRDNHQKIFNAAKLLFEKGDPIDILTVTSQLRKLGELEMIGGAYYITELTNRIASTSNIKTHSLIIYEKFLQREMIRISTETINSAYEDTTDVFEMVEKNQKETYSLMANQNGRDVKNIGDLGRQRLKDYQATTLSGLTGLGSGFTSIDEITGGWQKKDLIIVAARPAMGKAQPLNSKVLTPTGFKKIGELKIGDVICNSGGGIQKVNGVFPQGKKQTYTVMFNDDTETRCCDEHLWLTHSRSERKNKMDPSVKSLNEIRNTLKTGKDNRKNHSVDFVEPVFFSAKKLLIDPYLMGVLLGDGCLSHLSITNPEFDIIERISKALPEGCVIKRKKSNIRCPEYRINGVTVGKNPLIGLLKHYGLDSKLSADKIIPPEYLRNSFANRLELLRGLLDTDGYVVDRHCIEFSTTSKWIKIGIIDLVRSLGGRATFKEKQGKYTKNGIEVICQKFYRINISFTTNGFTPVTSKKHQERYGFSKNKLQKFISSVVPDKIEDCVCISVSHHDQLYITDDYILTHNTALALQIAKNASIKHETPVAIFSLEMSENQLTDRLISSETGIFQDKLLKRQLSKFDFEELESKTINLFKSKIFIDDTASLSITSLRSKAVRLKQLYGIGLIVIDYLQLMEGAKDKNTNREQEISKISRGLKGLAKDLDIPVIALSQLSREVEKRAGNAKRPMLSDLRESGSIEQDADSVLFLYRPEYYGIDYTENNESTMGLCEVIFAKNRSGICDTANLIFNGALMKFSDRQNIPFQAPQQPSNFIIRPNYMNED
jgi:replicative DNA helicase